MLSNDDGSELLESPLDLICRKSRDSVGTRSNAIQRRLAAGPLKRAPTNLGNHRTVVSTVGERRLNSQPTAVNDGSTPGVALLLSQRPANGVLTAVPLERRHRDLRHKRPTKRLQPSDAAVVKPRLDETGQRSGETY